MNKTKLKEDFENLDLTFFVSLVKNKHFIYRIIDSFESKYEILDVNVIFKSSINVEKKHQEDLIFLKNLKFNDKTLQEIFVNFIIFENLFEDNLSMKDFDLSNKNTRANIKAVAINTKLKENEIFKNHSLEEIIIWFELFKSLFNYSINNHRIY